MRALTRHSGTRFGLPISIVPMETKTAEELPVAPGVWQYEPKWDGFRCLAFREGENVELRAKSGKPLARYFPELVASLSALKARKFVLDGEIVIRIGPELSFEALQMRLHPAASRVRKLASETPATFILFDMLDDGSDDRVIDEPLIARREKLKAFVKHENTEVLILSKATTSASTAQAWLHESGRGATDGVVAKMLQEPYRPGERAMIKVKRLRTADCVVGGFRYLNSNAQVGSLLLGLYNEQGLLDHVGFTSMISRDDRSALTRRLEALKAPPGFTGKAPGGPSRWSTERSGEWVPVKPALVAEVRFDHVTGGRFRHGTKFLRWRPDKAPRQCTFVQIE